MAATTPLYEVPPDVLFQALGDEGVLLNLQNSRYYGLNAVGTRMWQLLQEHGSLEPVVAQMVDEYEIDEETLRRDLEDLVSQLVAQGILTVGTAQ